MAATLAGMCWSASTQTFWSPRSSWSRDMRIGKPRRSAAVG